MTTYPASSGSDELDQLVEKNLEDVRQRIAGAGRDPDSIRIVAVTKGFGVSHVEAAARAGLTCVGENYVNELVEKHEQCAAPVKWHFLGKVQSNKIHVLSRVVDVVASVARSKELLLFGNEAIRPSVYLQIDFTGSAARNGARLNEIAELLDVARTLDVRVLGLMTVASPDPSKARTTFRELVDAADAHQLPERSMGMSDDFEMACQLGSTEIRVGRLLFGPRPGR